MRMVQLSADTTADTTADPVRPAPGPVAADDIARWRDGVRARAAAAVEGFVRDRCAEYVRGIPGADFVTELLAGAVPGGKYVRPTFAYLGWLAGPGEEGTAESDAALRAAASTELLHAFALIQDDVMDRSAMRRGRPAVHVRSDWRARWARYGPASRRT